MAGNINPLVGMAKQVERTLQKRGDPLASKNCDLLANIYAQTKTVNSLLNKPLEPENTAEAKSKETPLSIAPTTQLPKSIPKVVPSVTATMSKKLSGVKPFDQEGSPKTSTSSSALIDSLFDSESESESESVDKSPDVRSFEPNLTANVNTSKNLNMVAPFKSNVSKEAVTNGNQLWPVKPFESDSQSRGGTENNIRVNNQMGAQPSTTTINNYPMRRFETDWSSGLTSSPSDVSRESRDLDFDSRTMGDVDKVLRVSPQRPPSDFLSDSQDSQSSERSQDLSSSSFSMPSFDSNQSYNSSHYPPITSSVPYNVPLTSSMMMPSIPDFSSFPSMSSYPVQRGYGQFPMPGYPYHMSHPMLLPQPNMDVSSDYLRYSRPISQHTVNMDTLSGSNVLSMPPYHGSPMADMLPIPPSHHKSSASSTGNHPVSQDNSML